MGIRPLGIGTSLTPSTARFSLRHPDERVTSVAARRAIEEAHETKQVRAAEDAARTIGDPRDSHRFYSPQAREIAAIDDATLREERLSALGFFGLGIRAEVELLRLATRTAAAPISPHAAA